MLKMVHSTNLMSEVIKTSNMNAAFQHVRKCRLQDSPHSDIWGLSLAWDTERATLQNELLSGTYHLSPIEVYRTKQHGIMSRFNSRDTLVLKAISIIITSLISKEVGMSCTHLAGHGGLKGSIRTLLNTIKGYSYVIRSDVASFYDSMNHDIIMLHLKKIIQDTRILRIIEQYLNRLECLDGEYRLITRAIPKGCPLSPLLGALILKSLDTIVPKEHGYIRYMDDWVILSKTRSSLRRLVKKMHQVMHRLKFKLAIDKTFIGKIARGFDFLGYRFSDQGIIGLAAKTIQNFYRNTFSGG